MSAENLEKCVAASSTTHIPGKFYPLTPLHSTALEGYREAFHFAFSNPDIRNIALSGAYGSGKSTIMQSYENIHGEKKFIHISLARFEEAESGEAPDTSSESLCATPEKKYAVDSGSLAFSKTKDAGDKKAIVNVLEGKILNQLLHQIPPASIPQSNFRIKKEVPPLRQALIVVGVLAFLALLLYQFQFAAWGSIVAQLADTPLKALLIGTITPSFRLFALLFSFLLIGCFLFSLFRGHNFQNIFKKVDVKGIVGIEIFEAETNSYFDKYLNEVLYLFDHSGADAIVFEDLDRYEVTLIFEKLREINDLVYRKQAQRLRSGRVEKPLRFFYLIRDDVFTTSDRSKFFDFIIPVVPIIDNSNSREKLLERFSALHLTERFNRVFLRDISLYLSDMRLINNIINEYVIYSNRLKSSSLATDPSRQLAIIIYKNLFPEDFTLLQQGRGYVFTLLEQKKTLIENRKKALDEDIYLLQQKLSATQDEELEDLNELNALFFPLTEEIISIDDSTVSQELSRTKLVEAIFAHPEGVICFKNGSRSTLDFDAKRKQMEGNKTYCIRKAIIQDKAPDRQKEFHHQLQVLKERRIKADLMTVKELLASSDELDETFWTCELPGYERPNYVSNVKNSVWFSLLRYLVRNGYIDETYSSYVSYFYPGSLTARDKNFLLALADHKSLGYDYTLDHPSEVLSDLEDSDFARKELFNDALLRFLLHENDLSILQTWLVHMEHAPDIENDAFTFLLNFWTTYPKEAKRFVSIINSERPSWFHRWVDGGLLDAVSQRKYALESLYYSEPATLQKMNQNDWLTTLISSDPEFLIIKNPKIKPIQAGFTTLQVKFRALTLQGSDTTLVDWVYQNNFYVLNFAMIQAWMEQYWNLRKKEIMEKNFTHLCQKQDSSLYQRISRNMEEYMSTLLQESTGPFCDKAQDVVTLLNCEEISLKNRKSYIARLRTELKTLQSISNTQLWPSLLEGNHVQYSWENIADYFVNFQEEEDILPAELANFIESCEKNFTWSYASLNNRVGTASADAFRRVLAKDTTFSNTHYQRILSRMGFCYKDCSSIDLPLSRLDILFELRIISMSVKNIEYIRLNFPQKFEDFVILADTEAFINSVEANTVTVSEKELVSLLSDRRLMQGYALRLLKTYTGVLSLTSTVYPPHVKEAILRSHFDTDDFPALFQSFASDPPEVRAAIISAAQENYDAVVAASKEIKFLPTAIYAACLETFSIEQAKALRQYLANKDFEHVCASNKRPSFSNTQENKIILAYFLKHGWISSYSELHNGKIQARGKRH